MIDRRSFLYWLTFGTLAAPLAAGAQPPGKVPRVGMLRQGSAPDPHVQAFLQGLRDLGYVEGRNIDIEYRWAEGRNERLARLAADLVRLKVDVIIASTSAAVAAKRATTAIPIVMPISSDPVRAGLVASLARPGGNVTGFSSQNEELPGKWIELMKEGFPEISRVAVLWDPDNDVGQLRASEIGAQAVGLPLQALRVRRPEDFGPSFAEAQKNRAGGVIVLSSGLLYAYRSRVVELAAKHRLPTLYNDKAFVDVGGLMSYGADVNDLFRRAAAYVDRILKGAKPADLPVEQPTKFELLINLKTAKVLGLTIPQTLLLRADQVIE